MISPSRTNKPSSLTHFPYGRGVSGRQWRSAANRPSRQARRGWASLYEAPSQKKNHLPRATKIQQPKKFLPRINLPQRHLPAQKIPPHAPPSQPWPDPRLFRAKPGPIWVRTGLFWVAFGSIPGFPGPKSRCFGPRFPLPWSPPPPRETCKNFTSQPVHPSAPSPPQFPKIAQNII